MISLELICDSPQILCLGWLLLTSPTAARAVEDHFLYISSFPGGSDYSSCNAGNLGLILGLARSLEKGMITHSSILAWRIPWTEEPGGLQSMWLQKVRQDLVTNTFTFLYTLGLHLGWQVMFILVGMHWKVMTQNIHSASSDTAAAHPHVDLWNFKESTEGLHKHLQETAQALISGWGLM